MSEVERGKEVCQDCHGSGKSKPELDLSDIAIFGFPTIRYTTGACYRCNGSGKVVVLKNKNQVKIADSKPIGLLPIIGLLLFVISIAVTFSFAASGYEKRTGCKLHESFLQKQEINNINPKAIFSVKSSKQKGYFCVDYDNF